MPSVCWKTRPPSIANMFSIKKSSMLMISVSENFMVESECFLQNKICPFIGKVFVSTLVIPFYETQLDIFS
jgi:hypothetical protein